MTRPAPKRRHPLPSVRCTEPACQAEASLWERMNEKARQGEWRCALHTNPQEARR